MFPNLEKLVHATHYFNQEKY